MNAAISEHVLTTDRHSTFFLACGPDDGLPVIFCHGWPELSITWRNQLTAMGGLGLRAVAPDMRGYGKSTVHPNKEDYSVEEISRDMIELLDHLGTEKAVWVGHDLGAPVVWSIAQHYPERCRGVAGVCVPYLPAGLTLDELVNVSDRSIYPSDQFPNAQWDYIAFYQEDFDLATKAFDADPLSAIHILFRSGDPAGEGLPALTATTRARGGWFGPKGAPAPKIPRDGRVLSKEEAQAYADALTRNGFAGPDSWYMNGATNAAYAETARDAWRLDMPVLFVHAAYDYVCATIDSKLADPMRAHCADLTETTVNSGHWMAQEKPAQLNAAIVKWLAAKFPSDWPTN